MYVIEYRRIRNPQGRHTLIEHLWEMTAAELKAASASDNDDHWHDRISAEVAHNIVKTDRFPHSTNLWVNWDGKVRRA